MKDKIISISFVLFLFYFMILGVITKDQEISKEERRKLISRNTEKSGRFGGRSIFVWRRKNTNYCAKNPDAVHNRIGIKHVRISI